MSPHDVHRIFGGQLRAGRWPQRNPLPVTTHRAHGLRPALSRLLRRIFGD